MVVKFLPPLREQVGRDSINIELPAGTTVAQALNALRADYPHLDKAMDRVLFMVNYQRAALDTILQDGDQLICFQVLGGG
ncbi:MAG: MoaD/ThiS family protein [Anaerolineae bacterium]